ncbi:MAG: helix-turn-helix transcriptional regulator, partial [Eubacteriales bacterium]|nr:helix-turn-helix transcriptional regulator [Eubacteriales bacterium]
MPQVRKTPLPFPRSGECIRYYRELRGYTQEELANMIGISPSYLGYIERSR